MSMQIAKTFSFVALAAVAGMTAAHSASFYRAAPKANIEAPTVAPTLGHAALSTPVGLGAMHAQASRPSEVVAALDPNLLHHYP